MPVSLGSAGLDLGKEAKRRGLTVQELEQELAAARAAQAQAEEAARVEEARLRRERDQARRVLRQRLAVLRDQTSQPLPEAERPHPMTRARAREFLHGSSGDLPAVALLDQLAGDDLLVGLFRERSRIAGRLLTDCAAAGVDGALFDEVDDLECAAWAACMRRVHEVAGEVAP